MKKYILIVDDDENIRNLLSIYLENEGFKTIKAENAKEALKIIEEKEIELILLDIMMPQIDGIDACIRIRKDKNMPIIMISAKSEDIDKIHGLTVGADDYITKPFNPLELIARVKSQLRRYQKYNTDTNNLNTFIEIGELKIDTDTRQVWVGEREVRLTPKEFDILELLARHKGIVLSIRKIYENVWKEEFFRSDNTVTVHITKIREKIEAEPKAPIYIKTIWGAGYKI